MSDLVAKLSADTSGFTPAVKKAKQALEEYSSIAGRAKRDSEGLTQDQIQGFNRLTNSLQRVGGAFRTTKQDIDTMKNVLRALTAEYSRLDEKTRNTDYGKNLRGVIDSTSQKLNEMRQVQAQTNRTIDEGKNKTNAYNGVLGQFSSKLGVSTGMLTKCGIAMAAVTTALKVLSDAFMTTEDNFDAFNRSVASAEGAYSSFLATIQTGDWSNFFSNIGNAISAYSQLYDLMDRAGSYKTYNTPAIQRLESEASKYQAIINDKSKTEAERKKAQAELNATTSKITKLYQEQATTLYKAGRQKAYNAIALNQGKYLGGRNGDTLLSRKQISALVTELERGGNSVIEKYKQAFRDNSIIAKGRKLTQQEYLAYRYGKVLTKVANDDADKSYSLAQAMRDLGEAATIERQANDAARRYNRFSQKEITTPKATTTYKAPKVQKEPLIEGTIAWYQDQVRKLDDQITKKTQVNDTQAITTLKRQRDEIEELLKTKNEMTDIIAKAQRGYASFDELLKLKDYKGNIAGNPLKESELGLIKGQKASDISKFMDIPSLNATVKEQIEAIWLDAMQRALKKAVDQGGDWKSPYTQLYEYYQYRGNGDRDKWMSQMGSLRRNYLPQLILNGTSFKDLGETFNRSRILDTIKGMGLSMQSTTKPSRFNMEQYKSVLAILEQIKETSPIGSEDYEWAVELITKISEALKKLTETTFESRLPEWWDSLASAISQTGGAIGGLTGKWISSMAQIASLTKQAIDLADKYKQAKAAEAVANSVAESSKAPWIIQAAVIALNLASVIAGLMQADKFAGGGIVQGTKLGDRNIAQVNGGEMILNTSEQGRLFRLLKGQGGIGNQTATATISSVKVSGSDLYLTLKNYMKNNKTKTL